MKRYKPEDYPKYDNYDAINVICLMVNHGGCGKPVRIPASLSGGFCDDVMGGKKE